MSGSINTVDIPLAREIIRQDELIESMRKTLVVQSETIENLKDYVQRYADVAEKLVGLLEKAYDRIEADRTESQQAKCLNPDRT